jgi:hypothetical protein
MRDEDFIRVVLNGHSHRALALFDVNSNTDDDSK